MPASERAIRHALSRPGGGNAVGLVVGGAAEALRTTPTKYRILVSKRKGFCRLALQHGYVKVQLVKSFLLNSMELCF